MLSFFRRLSKSAVGTGLMVLILLMILAGFAMQDIRSVFSGNFGMSKGTLVKIGNEPVSERDLDNAMVRFVISPISPKEARFEQSYSADGGATWETNWIAVDTRLPN